LAPHYLAAAPKGPARLCRLAGEPIVDWFDEDATGLIRVQLAPDTFDDEALA